MFLSNLPLDGKGVLVVFPGLAESQADCIAAMLKAGLRVDHLVWDKTRKDGVMGGRLAYSNEIILVGWTQVQYTFVSNGLVFHR